MTVPDGRFVAVDGFSLHYLEQGAGPAVVWVHGLGGTARDAAYDMLGVLGQRHRVLAFDRPGYGQSPGRYAASPVVEQARALLDACRRIGLDHPVVVGHSFGALVAVAMALEAPGALSGVVLVAGYLYPHRVVRSTLGGCLLSAIPRRFLGKPWLSHLATRLIERQVFFPDPVPAGFFDVFSLKEAFRPGPVVHTAGEMRAIALEAGRLCRRYSDIEIPVALIAATADRLTPAEAHAFRLKRALPGAELFLAPGHGHMTHHADSDIVKRALLWVEQRASERRREGP